MRLLGWAAPLWILLGSPAGDGTRTEPPPGVSLEQGIAAFGLTNFGVELGIEVWLEGKGILYSREADVSRAAASAIKVAIAVDLLRTLPDQLEESPTGLATLLSRGQHPAFDGFTPDELGRCREALFGRSYWEMARIMMGREPATSEVYNAACNVLMVQLGGPGAIAGRIRTLDPVFAELDLNRYMQQWNKDGDNRITPRALARLYRMTARGEFPGLDAGQHHRLRSLLLDQGDGGSGSVFEKAGTLYSDPMARIHAGYVERDGGDLVYVVMGEVSPAGGEMQEIEARELFLRLMSVVDAVTVICRDLGEFAGD